MALVNGGCVAQGGSGYVFIKHWEDNCIGLRLHWESATLALAVGYYRVRQQT